ncbi:MAG TPA: HDOD domain-containing protein [Polyangiaceae bacterium]|nr:HDOD domain-containing protein [Polyangiaceae bacterium]
MTYEINVQLSKHLLPSLGESAAVSLAEAALVQTLEGGRAALPLLPQVATQALELANKKESTVREFAELIMKDPPIAARFLATANSALYSRGQTIRSVPDAVARIGLAASRDLVFQVVYASSAAGMKHFQAEVQASFHRSVLCGMLCRIAAPLLGLDVSDAYLCGLLHDIGESRVYRILDEGKQVPHPVEASALVRKHHPRAGAELAMRWALPDDIVQVCRRHEEPGPPATDRLRLVRVADVLAPRVAEPAGQFPPLADEKLDRLGVSLDLAHTLLQRGVEAATRL